MSGTFDYVRYDDASVRKQEAFKAACAALEAKLLDDLAPSRARSLAATKLEEVYMWIGKAFRDEQIARGGDATHRPERGE